MPVVRQVVAYLRVSTDRQGRSGLGLDAQRVAVLAFAEANGLDVVAEHVEVETGKGSDALERRPQFAAELAMARKVKGAVGSPSSTGSAATWPSSPT
ncbi:recombinase family protein [Lichenibacterium dinghuense]|uniref:recombinase family protein n=1 Tax=Lichenibacterium dinghuense TaxID=2895977 RepID=UPI002814CEDB|nr:recombinase family protein [Lichenibacterium sp. 6Y81]